MPRASAASVPGLRQRVSSDCAVAPESEGSLVSGLSLDEATVYSTENGRMFHTWTFDPTGETGKVWITHDSEARSARARRGTSG